jgi:hypothetical protein
MKLTPQGMNLFIDPKGKRRENRGVAFPMKQQEGFSGEGSDERQEGNEKRANSHQKKHLETIDYQFPMCLARFPVRLKQV